MKEFHRHFAVLTRYRSVHSFVGGRATNKQPIATTVANTPISNLEYVITQRHRYFFNCIKRSQAVATDCRLSNN